MSTITDKIGRAKSQLIIRQPFVASLMLGMRMVENPHLQMKTLATDGRTIWYHPDWVEEHDEKHVAFGIAHEVFHCVFKHMFRRGAREPRRWNRAGDYVINGLLHAEGFPAAAEYLFDNDLVTKGGGTTEGVYALLQDQDGKGGDKGDDDPFDEIMDFDGTETEKDQCEAEMSVRIAQAAQAARMCGNMSAAMEAFVQSSIKAKVAWEDVLRRFLNRAAKVEYTFARPKRRHLHAGLYLPSLGGQAMGDLVVAVDQSGSVTMEETAQFGAEIEAQHKDCRPSKLHVLYFDSAVQRHDEYDPDDEVTIGRYACGGTAFSPIFRKIEGLEIEPCAVVVLTDLCCNDFGPEPDYPVLWVTTCQTAAPWGEVISMKDEL